MALSRDDIRHRITEILADIVDDETLELDDDTTADDVEEWDSLNHVKLIVAIEQAFHVRFDVDEITMPQNVGELVDMVARKLDVAA